MLLLFKVALLSFLVMSNCVWLFHEFFLLKLLQSTFYRTSGALAYRVGCISCCCLHHVVVVQSSVVVVSSDVKLRVAFSRVFSSKRILIQLKSEGRNSQVESCNTDLGERRKYYLPGSRAVGMSENPVRSSNVVGIICLPPVGIGLTDLPDIGPP